MTIGGASVLDANHVVVVGQGIESSGGAENQLIQNNLIGLSYAGTELAATPVPVGAHGILAWATEGGDARVLDNRVAGPGTMDDPIETIGGPALIAGNVVGLGTDGEALPGGTRASTSSPARPAAGRPRSATSCRTRPLPESSYRPPAERRSPGTSSSTRGFAGGIWVHGTPSTDNTIGGDTPAEENFIAGTDGPAIAIQENVNIRNIIVRNRGSDNAGPFIDLGNDGEGNSQVGPNGGIQAPRITDAHQNTISGTADPGASVLVFSKASTAAGEIAGFLGSAVVDPAGSWQVDYGSAVAAGSSVAASQTTSASGTSELAIATTAADPSPPADADAPETAITKAPPKRSRKRWAEFRFTSTEPGTTFECSLNGAAFTPCASPLALKGKKGRNHFEVRAKDQAGNTDASPASDDWKVRKRKK